MANVRSSNNILAGIVCMIVVSYAILMYDALHYDQPLNFFPRFLSYVVLTCLHLAKK